MSSQQTGWLGETRAALYVRRQGMRLLARRYRAAHGEVDLIAQDQGTLVFIEVKARPHGHLDDGFRAVNAEKRRRLRSAAQAYQMNAGWSGTVRFDIIEISAAGLRHMKNAF